MSKKLLVSGLTPIAIAILLLFPITISASTAPQPLPEGINCTQAASTANSIHAAVFGSLGNFSMTFTATGANLSYSMNGVRYDSTVGKFVIDSMTIQAYNTTTNKELIYGDARGIFFDTHSNATYAVFTFAISSVTWKADPKIMQEIYPALPLTNLSLKDFTINLGLDCANNTYTIGGQQQTNALTIIKAAV